MDVKKRLDELVREGAVIAIHFTDFRKLELTLAAVAWLDDPPRLRWCAIFPEHQGHVHESQYTRAVLDAGGRDVAFYDENDDLIMYVCPYIEAELPTDEVREALAKWRAGLATFNNAEEFDHFFKTA